MKLKSTSIYLGIVSLLLVTLCNLAFGQEYLAKNYTTEHGLPSNECYQVFQDKKGFIWIATDQGLVRYDGFDFKTFDETHGLGDDCIFRITELRDTLIVSSKDDKFYAFVNDTFLVTPVLKQVNDEVSKLNLSSFDFSKLANGDVLIGALHSYSSKLVYFVLNKTRSTVQKHVENSHASKKSVIFFESTNGSIAKSTAYPKPKEANKPEELTIKVFSSQGKNLLSKEITYPKKSITDWLNICRIKDNEFITFTGRMLHYISQNEFKPLYIAESEFIHGSSVKINDSTILVGVRNTGYLRLDLNRMEYTVYHTKEIKNASGFCMDTEDGLWISTLENGIYYVNNPSFKKLRTGINIEKFSSLTSIGKELFAGTKSGLIHKINANTGKIVTTYDLNSNKIQDIATIDSFVFATCNTKVYRDPINYKDQILYGQFPSSTNISVWNNQVVWFGDVINGNYGVGKFDIHKKKFSIIDNPNQYQYKFSKILDVLQLERSNRILFLTDKGILESEVDPTKYTPVSFHLESYQINDLMHVSDEKLLITTEKSGILLYDLKSKYIIDQVTNYHDVSLKNSLEIFRQFSNRFWVTTKNGICIIIINNETMELDHFLPNTYNIKGKQVNDIEFNSGKAWFATNSGLMYIDTSKIYSRQFDIPTFFESATLNDSTKRPFNTESTLNHKENNITISFHGLSYKPYDIPKFKYKISPGAGYFKPQQGNSISLINLQPETYRIDIKSINNSGLESSDTASFSFTISPPFWKTWWFITICIVTGLILVYLLARNRIKELKQKHALQNSLIELKQQALNSQMNPHFIFNTMGSIQSLIIRNKNFEAEEYLTKLSKLMRNILHSSDNLFQPINEELNILENYIKLENLRHNNAIEFSYHVDSTINPDKVLIPSMTLQTLIENAIMHGILPTGKQGLIQVNFNKTNNQLKIEVQDNGIGIEESINRKNKQNTQHKSKGTQIIKDRIESLKQLYKTESSIEFKDLKHLGKQGTVVTLIIPFETREGII